MTDRETTREPPTYEGPPSIPRGVGTSSTEETILRELVDENPEYSSFESLRAALDNVLEHHVKDMPAQFDPFDVLVWGSRHGWLTFRGDEAVISPPDSGSG